MNTEPARLPAAESGELVEGRDAAGDRDEQFAAFVVGAGPYLLHTAELLCGDRARAQDLVQATFERTYRSWSKASDGDPWAYARRIRGRTRRRPTTPLPSRLGTRWSARWHDCRSRNGGWSSCGFCST